MVATIWNPFVIANTKLHSAEKIAAIVSGRISDTRRSFGRNARPAAPGAGSGRGARPQTGARRARRR